MSVAAAESRNLTPPDEPASVASPKDRSGASAPAALIVSLLEAFDRDSVRYCYWKSGRRVLQALSGDSDLDVLICREDRQSATKIFDQLGFRRWPDAPGRDQPTVESFLGYDEATGRLLHAHVVYRIVVGHAMFKNWRLPFESAVLARSAKHGTLPVRVLDPIDEAIILVARANLGGDWLDPIAMRDRKALSIKFEDDFRWLAPRIDEKALRKRSLEWFSPDLAEMIVARLTGGEKTLAVWTIRRRLKRELSSFRAYNAVEDRFRVLARSALGAVRIFNRRLLHWPRPSARRAPGGGVVIAIVGVDGSGKSTMVARSRAWLGAEMDVMPVYFGTGDGAPSIYLLPFKLAAGVVSSRMKVKPKGASHGAVSDRPPGFLYSTFFAIWACAVAIDKRHKLIMAQRAAARGMVVVTDRYPQNESETFNDGPLLHRLPRCPAWLRRFEASVYKLAERAPPDLAIKLHVGPEAVARREPDMVPAVAIQRIALLRDLRFSGARTVSIDATQPLETVLALVKRAIWEIL